MSGNAGIYNKTTLKYLETYGIGHKNYVGRICMAVKDKVLDIFKHRQPKWEGKAKVIIKDKKRLKELMYDVVHLSQSKKEILKDIVDDVKLLVELLRDYFTGKYKNISVLALIKIIAGLLYFVTPVDIVPDILPGGYVDDITVLIYILKQVHNEIIVYKSWKESNNVNGLHVVNTDDDFDNLIMVDEVAVSDDAE